MKTPLTDLTKDKALELHKKLWLAMADLAREGIVPDKEIGLYRIGFSEWNVTYDCFLCHYTHDFVSKHSADSDAYADNQTKVLTCEDSEYCQLCPVDFGYDYSKINYDYRPCTFDESPYSRFNQLHSDIEPLCFEGSDFQKEMIELCTQIANLPEEKVYGVGKA